MEEELQKRNTDCVYFLASPLTCKKGVECEYRHNEMARLNPRDCWYWLAGSCLNPTCAFRHPPLDAHSETGSELAPPKQQSVLPVNKTNVPCYYFYNGFCNKGDSCFFMHGPDGNAPSWKSTKQASAVADAPLSEKKMSKGSDSRPAVAEMSSFTTDSKSAAGTKVVPELKSWQPVPDSFTKKNASQQISESSPEEAATIRSNSPSHTGGLIQRSHESPYQSSDNQFADNIKKEDWLESSPGFDVLVNDRAEDVDYEDEALYALQHDMEEREIDGQHLRHDFDDNMGYDPTSPEIRVSFERGLPGYYGHLDKDTRTNARRTPISARERVLDHTLRGRRGLNSYDLRDYLKNRRMTESQHSNIFFGTPNSSSLMGQITEKAYFGDRGIHGRLASKVEVSVESRIERETFRSGVYHQHHKARPASSKGFRKQTKERKLGKRHFSEMSGQSVPRKRRSIEESTMFTGPKTLAQLKEEKKKVLSSVDAHDGTGPSSIKA